MRMQPSERRRPTASREVLDFSEDEDRSLEVERLIQRYKPKISEWIAKNSKKDLSHLENVSTAVDLFPELQEGLEIKPVEYEFYRDQMDNIRYTMGNGGYVCALLRWFPERKADIQSEYSVAIRNMRATARRDSDLEAFLAAQQLLWLQSADQGALQKMRGSLPGVIDRVKNFDRLYMQVIQGSKILVSCPEAREELQKYFAVRLPQIQVEAVRLEPSNADLPGFLHGLKIIFAEQVTADEFGRLMFQMKERRIGKEKPLPARAEV